MAVISPGGCQVDAIRFGDSAFVGFKPEVDAATEQQLQSAAQKMGYSHVMLDSFLAGDSKYMPHAAAYSAPLTVEAQKKPGLQSAELKNW